MTCAKDYVFNRFKKIIQIMLDQLDIAKVGGTMRTNLPKTLDPLIFTIQ